MKRAIVLALVLGMLSVLGACAHMPTAPPERILMVGNSLIYRNDLPAQLSTVASRVLGRPVEVEMLAGGGERIGQHAARGVGQRELASGRYTVLVLQEWGRGLRCDPEFAQFGFDCAASHAAHRTLVDAARRQGVRVLLLGTYSTDAEDARGLDDAERDLARTLDIERVGFGDWPGLRAHAPERAWLDADGAHPGPDLTLLMALRVAKMLYGDHAPTAPLMLRYRDYRGGATPKPDALASVQALDAPLLERLVVEADLRALTAP